MYFTFCPFLMGNFSYVRKFNCWQHLWFFVTLFMYASVISIHTHAWKWYAIIFYSTSRRSIRSWKDVNICLFLSWWILGFGTIHYCSLFITCFIFFFYLFILWEYFSPMWNRDRYHKVDAPFITRTKLCTSLI